MKPFVACLFCAFALLLQGRAEAHVLDQYLQVALITLAPDGPHVELRMTPGVQVADGIFAQIDRDADGRISSAEERAYARRVLQDIALEVDGGRASLTVAAMQFPSRQEVNEGIGEIRLDLAAEAPLAPAGEHQLSFRNDHLPELGTYLVNVLVPTTDAIAITRQQRDPLQREFQVGFRVASQARARLRWTDLWPFAICLALVLRGWVKRGSPPVLARPCRGRGRPTRS